MKLLYAPWRTSYVTESHHTKTEGIPQDECIFCTHFAQPDLDKKNLVIRRFDHTIVMLNLYPYNAGHLLILPSQHCAQLHQLSKEARAEMMEVTMHSINILTTELESQGMNSGLNLGKAAGAGIPSHLHMHILPRWIGDTNFLPALGNTKHISFDLNEIYNQLKPAFDEIAL
jgi:ATP adenylyltransferase